MILQNKPRVRSILFGRKSTDLITPTKRIVEEDERSEQTPKPPRYTTPSKPVMEYKSPPIDDDTDVEDEPKLKVKEHVSKSNLSIFFIFTPYGSIYRYNIVLKTKLKFSLFRKYVLSVKTLVYIPIFLKIDNKIYYHQYIQYEKIMLIT